jgi:hypothetical protein
MRQHKINLGEQHKIKKSLLIPEGWRLLQAHEAVLNTDQYAHLYKVCWLPVDPKNVDSPAELVADYIIRSDSKKPSPPVPKGWRLLNAHEIVSNNDHLIFRREINEPIYCFKKFRQKLPPEALNFKRYSPWLRSAISIVVFLV